MIIFYIQLFTPIDILNSITPQIQGLGIVNFILKVCRLGK